MNYNHFPFLSEKCADSLKCVGTSGGTLEQVTGSAAGVSGSSREMTAAFKGKVGRFPDIVTLTF